MVDTIISFSLGTLFGLYMGFIFYSMLIMSRNFDDSDEEDDEE